MGKLRVKWLKTGAFPWQIPVLLTIGSIGKYISLFDITIVPVIPKN